MWLKRHAFTVASLLAFAILWTGTVASAQPPPPGPSIQVQVTDTTGLNIDGALVEIYSQTTSALVEIGRTTNGTFLSTAVQSGTSYNVIVSTQAQTKQRTVSVGSKTVVLLFSLIRSLPITQLAVSSVSFKLVTHGSTYLQGEFVVRNTGQTNITSSSIEFNSSFPLIVLGTGSQFSLGSIPANSSRTLKANFTVGSGSLQGPYSIPYLLVFADNFGRGFSNAGTFGANPGSIIGTTGLVVSSVASIQRLPEAHAVEADFVLDNIGQLSIVTSFIQFNTAGSPLTVVNAGGQFVIGPITANSSRTLRVDFALQSGASQGIYSVPYLLIFTDSIGRVTTVNGAISLVVGSPDVKLSSVKLSSTNLKPGDNSLININLANIGDGQAIDLRVAVSGMTAALSSSFAYLGILGPQGSASTEFGLNLPRDYPARTYTLNITITYKDTEGRVYHDSQPYGINVFPRGEPIVKVQNILTDPVLLTDGTSGLATLFLTNVGTDQARNVIVRVSGGQDILANGVFTLGQINPSESQTIILGLNISPNTLPGPHLLAISLTYSNPVGQLFNQSSFVELRIFPTTTLFTPVNDAILAGVGTAIIAIIVVARKLNLKL